MWALSLEEEGDKHRHLRHLGHSTKSEINGNDPSIVTALIIITSNGTDMSQQDIAKGGNRQT